jgi:hypothetical protein
MSKGDDFFYYYYDKYCRDFGYPIYGEMDMDLYSPSIYYVYFDDNYIDDDIIKKAINSSNNVINGVLVDK